MPDSATVVLGSLRDISGIAGSFVVSPTGELLARDMGALFTDELLSEIAPRVVRLGEAFSAESEDVNACTLRFADHLLYMRNLGRGSLCVLSALQVNMPALRMGVNLAARRLAPLLEAGLDLASRAPAPAAPPPRPPPPAPAPEPPKAVRMWRGRPVED